MVRSKLGLEEGWTTFFLLMLMMLCVVWSVRAAEWTGGLGILQWVALAGMLCGLCLSQARRVPALAAHVLGLAAGCLWVTAMLTLVFQPPLVPADLVLPGQGLLATVRTMAQTALTWFRNPASAEAWLSNFLFVCNLATLTWLLSYSSVWFVFRRHWIWGAIVPLGAACLLNIYYSPPRLLPYLTFFCLCALLLVVRLHIHLREKGWRRAAVNYNLDVDLSFLRDAALVSTLALVMAWTLPVAAANTRVKNMWASFQDPWHAVQTQWSRLFTALNYHGQSSLVRFGRTLTLGGAVNLSDTPVMDVQADRPYYWRAASYNQYTGSGWVDTNKAELRFQGIGTVLTPFAFSQQWPVTYTVRPLTAGEDHLFFAGQPMAVSLPAKAALYYVPQANGGQAMDVSALYSNKTLRSGQSYTIVSLVSGASINELDAAGTDYPGWVTARYLQVPQALPVRVLNLSREVTKGATTPYQKALAIQDYLRRIDYDQYISAPPAGRDVVDWFLFENRKGYCDYYASAMAIMCRLVGVPARICQGYTAGEYAAASSGYRVRQRNAHAWAEVFFPNYGWIEFEPTASQPTISRPQSAALPLPIGQAGDAAGLSDERERRKPNEDLIEEVNLPEESSQVKKPWHAGLWPLALALAILLTSGLLGVVGWWFTSLRGLSAAARAFEQMRRLGTLLGVPQLSHQTPREYGEVLALNLLHGPENAPRVAELFVKSQLSRHGLGPEEENELQQRWAGLRLHMCQQLLRSRWHKRKARGGWASPNSLRPRNSLE